MDREKDKTRPDQTSNHLSLFKKELQNFEDIAKHMKPSPGDIPDLKGIDIYGQSVPLNGLIGGDHIIYVDFNKRYDIDLRLRRASEQGKFDILDKLRENKNRAGILIADVSGHNITDALLASMLHQAFLLGVLYELKLNGMVTTNLFEKLNTRFYNTASSSKFITMIYGEISDEGNFRFLNAGHPAPAVFSYEFNRLSRVKSENVIHFTPIGTVPSREDVDSKKTVTHRGYKDNYSVETIDLMGHGDILLLYTDGLSEHNINLKDFYFPGRLEKLLIREKNRPAREIFMAIKKDLFRFSNPEDDISLVVIKRT